MRSKWAIAGWTSPDCPVVSQEHYKLDVNISHTSTFPGEVEIDISLNNKSRRNDLMRSMLGKIPSDAFRIIPHADKFLQIHEVGFVEIKRQPVALQIGSRMLSWLE